mgnify:CR=1 FL=1
MGRIPPLLISVLLVWPASHLAADESDWGAFWDQLQGERLQVHGFASLTGVKTSANRFYGDSPNGTLDAAEVGLNASYQLNSRILFAGQVLSRMAGDMYDGTPALDYALVDLTLAETDSHSFGLRLGRLKNPIGLYNETRDVPFTRPSIFLPQVVYFDKVRNLMLSTDGAMFHGDLSTGHGRYTLTLGGGQPVTDENLEWVFLGDDLPGKLNPRGVSWVGSLWYSTLNERLRLGVSGLSTQLSYNPRGQGDLGPGQTSFTYLILSAQYNTERWTLSSEYARLPLHYRDYGDFFPYRDFDGEGYYLQAAYRLRPQLEVLARYEDGFADRNLRDGEVLSDQTGGLIPHFDFYDHAWTAGLTWNPSQYMMLRAQYSRHNGTYSLAERENDPADLVKDWDLFALQFAVRF